MKKLLVCVAALGMLFTSCMRDETRLDEGSVVSFNISAPAVSTRADNINDKYGIGVAAEELHYAIFEVGDDGEPNYDKVLNIAPASPITDFFAGETKEKELQVRLVKGKSYVAMFWAQAPGAPYTIDWPNVTMGEVNSNDENLDAFFNICKFTIDPAQDLPMQEVELRRPFAQVNVALGSNDLEAAKTAGFEITKAGITVTDVPNTLNVYDGTTTGEVDVTYTATTIPQNVIFVDTQANSEEYSVVSFNYVLVEGSIWDTESGEWVAKNTEDMTNVTFEYGNDTETLKQTFQNITVQRNHRTFILGSNDKENGLLTGSVDFNVVIVDDWDDPYHKTGIEMDPIEGITAKAAPAMGAATLTWNAVAGAEYYGVVYKSDEVQVMPNGTEKTKADEAAETVTYTTAANFVKDGAATADFKIKAYDANDKVFAEGEIEDVAVFSLKNRPEPAVYVADGKLFVENKELHLTESVKSNLDLNGILLEAEVYFYKDGATTPAYTARGSYIDTYPSADLPLSIKEKKIKNNVAGSYYTWKWDGATTATTALPAFEKGTYTIKYKAGYYPVINASFDRTPTDRIIYTDPSDVLAKMQYREGEVKDFKLVIAEATTPEAVAEGYQGAKVTWPAVDGAASYQVFVGTKKVADATTNEATVTGLNDANKYKFIVKSLDANGNVIATSVESNEVTIWNVEGDLMRAPVIDMTQLAAGTLYVDKTLDLTGVVRDMTVKFTDANGNVAHTAYYDKAAEVNGYNMVGQITGNKENGGRFTYNFFGRFICPTATMNQWTWDGATEPSAMPTFAPGEYTISWEANIWPIKNAYWSKSGEYDATKYATELEVVGGDATKIPADVRVHFANSADCLQQDIAKTGTFAEKFVVSAACEVTASIDEGTVLGRTLWGNGDSWYKGLASKNGMYNSAKIAWNNNSTFDKVVIAYGGKTVEINDGSFSNSTIIKDLQTSPVDFTVTFYNGATKVSEETVSTDVYVLPATDTSAKWVAKASGSGHKIYGTGWNTKQYTTCHVTFNIYEKGSDTPVFDKDVNYKGSIGTILAWTMGEKAPNGVCYAGAGNRACHGGDGNNWDEDNLPTGAIKDGEIFTGLDSSKEYVVKYTLKVWPYIYDASNANNVEAYTNDKGEILFNYFFKRMMVSGTAETYYNAVDLSGEANLTFE